MYFAHVHYVQCACSLYRVNCECTVLCTCCVQTEGPLYYLVLAMHMLSPARWGELRSKFFQRLLIMAHVRATTQIGTKV